MRGPPEYRVKGITYIEDKQKRNKDYIKRPTWDEVSRTDTHWRVNKQ